KELLLILDNCEHLVDAAARLVSGLLPGCPQLRILASSREALGIAGEIPFRVPSLAVPAVDEAVPVDRLHEYAAIHLFLERVALVQPRFTLTAANAAATVQICRRLDGIPLALELAAARVPVLGVQGVAARLDDRFRLLTGGSRTALPRQQTLRALIDWSWDLLNADERALLRRLAVFAGSWSLDAAEAVAGGESVLDTLAALANKSLVMVESAADPPRYRLLETIRQYARERLLAAGEAEAWRDRHLVYYLDLAERTAPHLASPDHTAAFARLDAEHENLRAALAWAQEHDALAELRLAGALGRFWQRGGHWHEARGWVEDALARPEAAAHTAARARALLLAGTLAGNQDEPVLARTRLEESVALSRELGDRSGLAWALSFLCRNTWPDDPAAWALGEESIALFRALGDRWGLAATLAQLASLAHVFYHDLAAATAMSEESLALFRALGDAGSTALPLGNLARHAYDRGDYATARTQFEEVLALLRAGGGKPALAGILLLLGEVARSEDDYARAEPIYAESLALYQAIGSRLQAAMVLVNLAAAALAQGAVAAAAARLRAVLPLVDGLEPARLRDGISTVVLGYLGIVATLQGQPARAARLFACVAVRRELIAPVASRADHAEFARYQAIAQGQLDAAAWASAWAAGEALALPDALAYALAPPDPA
ncbi:MAG TPA: hypothetical protein VKY74_20620, partial [Chloroflexia bacterium]|nr:hypothetical protein [Chloroflexia bacterium]